MRIHNVQCCSARGLLILICLSQLIGGLILGGLFSFLLVRDFNIIKKRNLGFLALAISLIVSSLLNLIAGSVLAVATKKQSISKLKIWIILEAFILACATAGLAVCLVFKLLTLYIILEITGMVFTAAFILIGIFHRRRLIKHRCAAGAADEDCYEEDDGENYVYGD